MEHQEPDDADLGELEISDSGMTAIWLIVMLSCACMAAGLIAVGIELWDVVVPWVSEVVS